MAACTITPVTFAETAELAEIGRRTFVETFSSGNDPAHLATYVAQAFTEEKMREELAAQGSSLFFARVDGVVAGYLKLNTGAAQTESVEGDTVEVERIYVDSRWQGAGVGKALMDFAIAEARRRGCEAIWLGVWEENSKAIAFYERQGFEAFGTHDFVIGEDVQTDILMRLPVQPGR